MGELAAIALPYIFTSGALARSAITVNRDLLKLARSAITVNHDILRLARSAITIAHDMCIYIYIYIFPKQCLHLGVLTLPQ